MAWLNSLIVSLFMAWLLGGNASAIASDAPFPKPGTIKGLQVQMVDDALELGIHHAAINVSLGALMDLQGKVGNPAWFCEGERYHFEATYLASLDAQIEPLAKRGVVVYAILLAYPTKQPEKDTVLVHPRARTDGKYNIAAFNTATQDGSRWLRAVAEFLAKRWQGKVWGWIVGNEVNSHWLWYNMGLASREEVAGEHEKAVRITYSAVTMAAKQARVYISLDHHWRASMSGISNGEATPGRDFLDAFARIARERGDFPWHVAHHPYPEDLGNPRVWADRSVTPEDNSPKVTFKNLEVLCDHLKRPNLLFSGQPRRIILSEQGFHTVSGSEGEMLQAAAYAYAWEKCQRLPMIDAFIYHRHVDHAHEGGLRLGIWSHVPGSIATPAKKKQLYELFRRAGTDAWDQAAQFALPIIGLDSWEQVFPPNNPKPTDLRQ